MVQKYPLFVNVHTIENGNALEKKLTFLVKRNDSIIIEVILTLLNHGWWKVNGITVGCQKKKAKTMIKLPRWKSSLNQFWCEINLFKEIKKVTQFYTFVIAASVIWEIQLFRERYIKETKEKWQENKFLICLFWFFQQNSSPSTTSNNVSSIFLSDNCWFLVCVFSQQSKINDSWQNVN